MLLFVYGTLMRGERANHLLDRCQFIDAATTHPGYRLVFATSRNAPGYPGMVRGTGVVRGEVWQVPSDVLTELDRYEGVPWLYRRGIVKVETFALGTVEGYLFNRPADALETIESGDWRQR